MTTRMNDTEYFAKTRDLRMQIKALEDDWTSPGMTQKQVNLQAELDQLISDYRNWVPEPVPFTAVDLWETQEATLHQDDGDIGPLFGMMLRAGILSLLGGAHPVVLRIEAEETRLYEEDVAANTQLWETETTAPWEDDDGIDEDEKLCMLINTGLASIWPSPVFEDEPNGSDHGPWINVGYYEGNGNFVSIIGGN